MTSEAADAERRLFVGLSRHAGDEVQPVGLLKLARHGVMESGEFAYGLRYLAQPDAQPLNPDHLPCEMPSFPCPSAVSATAARCR